MQGFAVQQLQSANTSMQHHLVHHSHRALAMGLATWFRQVSSWDLAGSGSARSATYRAWLDETGAPVGVQQKLMRHAHVSTTMDQYGNASALAKRKANRPIVQRLTGCRNWQASTTKVVIGYEAWPFISQRGGAFPRRESQQGFTYFLSFAACASSFKAAIVRAV